MRIKKYLYKKTEKLSLDFFLIIREKKLKISKTFILFMLIFWLFSCWDTSSDSWLVSKVLDKFEVGIPASWNVIDSWDSTMLPKPNYGEISLVASSIEPRDGFSNNLLILEDKIKKEIDSKNFSIFTNLWARNDYESYYELEAKDFVFNDKEESKLYVFEARYNENTPRIKFMQVGHICDDDSYLLTIALSSSIEDYSRYEDILKTFKCAVKDEKKDEDKEK